MASGGALIRESLWRDRDFRMLPRTAQCLYVQLLSQKDLDCAGILTLNSDVLIKGCSEMTLTNLGDDLKALVEGRFIVVDTDSDEVLIRSYIRLVSVKSPKVWVAAKSAAKRSSGPEIRLVLASELRRLGRADADELAKLLIPDGYGIDTVSEQYPNSIDTPYPIDTVSIPPSTNTVLVPVSSRVGGWVGRAADAAPTCPKHPQGPKHNEPCGICKQIREHAAATAAAEADQATQARAARRAAIDACPYCEETGLRETPDGMTHCTHDIDTFEVPF